MRTWAPPACRDMSVDHSIYDKRRYPIVDVREGYGAWVRTYEQTVQDEMDLRLLERVQDGRLVGGAICARPRVRHRADRGVAQPALLGGRRRWRRHHAGDARRGAEQGRLPDSWDRRRLEDRPARRDVRSLYSIAGGRALARSRTALPRGRARHTNAEAISSSWVFIPSSSWLACPLTSTGRRASP